MPEHDGTISYQILSKYLASTSSIKGTHSSAMWHSKDLPTRPSCCDATWQVLQPTQKSSSLILGNWLLCITRCAHFLHELSRYDKRRWHKKNKISKQTFWIYIMPSLVVEQILWKFVFLFHPAFKLKLYYGSTYSSLFAYFPLVRLPIIEGNRVMQSMEHRTKWIKLTRSAEELSPT